MLSKERRFDLILCIETWHKLEDSDRWLSQIRELLSQARREQEPSQVSNSVQCQQRLVIADVFRNDESA